MFNLKLDGLSVMGVAYVILILVGVIGYVFPSRRTAALVRATFVLCLAVVLVVIIWYGALMTFYYFNGGVSK